MAGRVLASSKNAPLHFACNAVTPDAQRPIRETDGAGWSIMVVKRTDNRVEDVVSDTNDFDTGLSISFPPGGYMEIVAAPTLHRHGYALLSPLVVDATYAGTIVLPLYKFREADDLELPMEVARGYIHVDTPDILYMESAQSQEREAPRSNVSFPSAPRGAPAKSRAGPQRPTGGSHMW